MTKPRIDRHGYVRQDTFLLLSISKHGLQVRAEVIVAEGYIPQGFRRARVYKSTQQAHAILLLSQLLGESIIMLADGLPARKLVQRNLHESVESQLL